MTGTFYHVDRRDELAAGQTVELDPVDERDRGDRLAALFPDGLSAHGRHYCEEDLYDAESDALWDVSCELVFELVRTERFPDRPSRFQSVFGFRSLRDAERFVDEFVDSPCTIWSVTPDDSFTADMRLVDAETFLHGVEQAHYYWRGSTYLDDPLWEALLVPPVDVVEAVGERP